MDNLHIAVESLQVKFPLLRDRSWFDEGLDKKLAELSRELLSGAFRPDGVMFYFSMMERKLLCAQLNARSWVAHEALTFGLLEWMDKTQVKNCAYKAGGTETLLSFCKEFKQEKDWVAGCDLKRFFGSVKHGVLLEQLVNLIPCGRSLQLITNFLEEFETASFHFSKNEPSHQYAKGSGLPAGLELSFLLAHAMLRSIDLGMIKRTGGHYLRYIDDMLFFANDELAIRNWTNELEAELGQIGLRINPGKHFIRPTSKPFQYLRQTF